MQTVLKRGSRTLFCRLLCLAILASSLAVCASGVGLAGGVNETTDEPSAWAKADVNWAITIGLVPQNLRCGYKNAATRAEFCALAVSLYELMEEREITGRAYFIDTDDVNVEKMGALNVVNGVGNDMFNPDATLTREQAATILSRLADALNEPLPDQTATFSDNTLISGWAITQVGQVQAAEIMLGVGNNSFDPKGGYTREQSIITLLRLYDFADKSESKLTNQTDQTVPARVNGLSGIIAVSAGQRYTLALSKTNIVWAWGDNENGQLGDGTVISRSAPVQVPGLSEIVSISAGDKHNLALKYDGVIWSWGDNSNGQLGDGTTTNRNTPVQIPDFSGAIEVSAGGGHSLARKTDGTVWAWGDNENGQLGEGSARTSAAPVQVSGLTDVAEIAAGGGHSLARKMDGTVWAWGDNENGQLGDGTVISRNAPVQVPGLTGIVSIAAGDNFSLALKNDGTIWAWGDNSNGQIDSGTAAYRSSPVQISDIADAVEVSAGGGHSLARKAGWTVWAWGDNENGQLGDGSTTNRSKPARVTELPRIVSVSAGSSHSAALSSHGAVYIWGNAPAKEQFVLSDNTPPLQSSPNSPGASVPSVPSYNNTSSLVLDIMRDEEYLVALSAYNITSFTDKKITIYYDNTKLELIDIANQVYDTITSPGAISETGITIVSVSPGKIELTFDQPIAQGNTWSGPITILKFKAEDTGRTTISVV